MSCLHYEDRHGFESDDEDDSYHSSDIMGIEKTESKWNMDIMCGHKSLNNISELIKQTRDTFTPLKI